MYITTVAYTQEHPITMPMVGAGQMPMLNARCLPIPTAVRSKTFT